MSIIERKPGDGQYILTGLQKYELLKGVTKSLAGRVSIIEMNALSLREFHEVSFDELFVTTEEYLNKRNKQVIEYNNLFKYIFQGGYPKIYHNNIKDVEAYYSDYVKTYLEKDVKGHIELQNENNFYKFLFR